MITFSLTHNDKMCFNRSARGAKNSKSTSSEVVVSDIYDIVYTYL